MWLTSKHTDKAGMHNMRIRIGIMLALSSAFLSADARMWRSHGSAHSTQGVVLEMPSGISGQQTVDVGSGPQSIVVLVGPSPGNSRNCFYVVVSDGVTDVQVTSNTTKPMCVTFDSPNDGYPHVQAFIFRGDWGITVSQVKTRDVTMNSMFGAGFGLGFYNNNFYTAVTYDISGRGVDGNGLPYGQTYYYFGPSLAHNQPSKGYNATITEMGHPELVWEPCNKLVPYVSCPPNYNRTADLISGATVRGVTHSPATLFDLVDNSPPTTTILPAGTFAGTARFFNSGNVVRGQGMDVTTIDAHGIQPWAGKAIFDIETVNITIADMTIKNAIVGNNASAMFLPSAAGYLFDHVKLTWNENGIHGSASSNDVTTDAHNPFRLENSIVTDNGNDSSQQHEVYVNGGHCLFNNDQIIAGPRPDHALKTRCFYMVVNGGTISGCTDPYSEVCGSVIDHSVGGNDDHQGMYSVKVGGTVHTGDVLTMTFHSNVTSAADIVVSTTVGAGQTAAQAATTLLTALQNEPSFAALEIFHERFYFSAGNTAKSTDTSDTINIFAPARIMDWTITPSVTGTGHTTTLTMKLTPEEIIMTSNVIDGTGSTFVIQYAPEQSSNHGTTRLNLSHVHITNQSPLYNLRFRMWFGGYLNLYDCHWSGIGVLTFDESPTRITGRCVNDSVVVNPADVSVDGTISNAPSGASTTTLDGVWTWGGAVGDGNYYILLNGSNVQARLSTGVLMRVANNGYMYIQTNSGGWYGFHSGDGSPSADPATASPDGTTLNAPTASTMVTIDDGTWSFGALSGRDYRVLLNGTPIPADNDTYGVQLKIAHGGHVYVKNNANNWFLWDGSFHPIQAAP